jgi:antitoxin component of MazEF toxin-antitoxin module
VFLHPISNVVGSPAVVMPPSLPTSCQLHDGSGLVLHFATHDSLLCVLVKKVRTSPLLELTMATGTVSVLSVLHGGDYIVAVPQL